MKISHIDPDHVSVPLRVDQGQVRTGGGAVDGLTFEDLARISAPEHSRPFAVYGALRNINAG